MQNQFPDELTFEYDLIKKIGEGSNGETWLAKSRITNMRVAVKCLKIGMIENLKAAELFMREAALLQSIQVQGVPRFYKSISPEQTGQGFLIQEFIDAPSIQDLLDSGTVFSESETLLIAEKVARILRQLQTQYQPPIIHRDLKPSNILCNCQTNEVWIIDFGSVANPQKRTGGSTVAGTFGYMPPEQIMGNVDIQADYYALGATMLHMMTGVMPSEMSSNVYQLDFEPTLAEKAPNTSNKTIDLLKKLLDPNPENRPASANELIQLMMITNENGKTQKKSLLARIKDWFRRLFITQNRDNTKDTSPVFSPAHSYKSVQEIQPLLTVHEIEQLHPDIKDPKSCALFTRNWVKTEGLIRKYSVTGTDKPRDTLEYTFDVDNRTYSGGILTYGNHEINAFPVKCTILYYPRNPRFNALYDFEHK